MPKLSRWTGLLWAAALLSACDATAVAARFAARRSPPEIGDALPGAGDAGGDGWHQRRLAAGVVWLHAVWTDDHGRPQAAHVLRIDPAPPSASNAASNALGVSVKAAGGEGCRRVSALVQEHGAIAGINGGYFGAGCRPLSLLRIGARLVARNVRSRGAFGIDARSTPFIQRVEAGADWPEAVEAQGGGPTLIRRGVRTTEQEWRTEGFGSAFFARHPRTFVGIDGLGRILFGTVDGRQPDAAGLTLEQLGRWLLTPPLSLVSALNLDGGGSSTMVVRQAGSAGVVNDPADGGGVPHQGERAVSGAWLVFAPGVPAAPGKRPKKPRP